MQKLTKEQSEWLIGKIMNNVRAGEFSDVVYADEIEEAINECTNKEFPECKIIFCEQKDVEINENPDFVKLVPWDEADPTHIIQLDYTSPQGEWSTILFYKEKFKEFTKGCTKIVEWLDEQE